MNFAPLPDPLVGEYFRYEAETGAIYWAKNWNNVHAGSRADLSLNKGYRIVTIKRRDYRAHRLAWYLTYGVWPDMTIDHINLDRSDNRLENLRLATTAQQGANVRPAFPGKTGSIKTASGRFAARIQAVGVRMHLGTFDTQEEAHAKYREVAVKFRGEFARFE